MILNIAICEDEREQQLLLEKYISNVKIDEPYELQKYDSGEELVKAYEAGERFSIILLDMQMNELDGIQTAEIIRKYDRDCIIIIITAILEYAVDGYRINAYDFILKPVDKDKFIQTFRNAMKKINTAKNMTYVIQTRDKTSILRLSEIIYIESNRKKITIHCEKDICSNNENIISAEKKLSAYGFVRISRFYLVNLSHIKEICVKSILLSTGETLNYSDKYQSAIKKSYMDFIMRDM